SSEPEPEHPLSARSPAMAMVGIVLVRMSPLSASNGVADGENRVRRTCDCAQNRLPAQEVGPDGQDMGFAARVRVFSFGRGSGAGLATCGYGVGRCHFREFVFAASRARRSEATSSTMTAIWRRLVMSAPYSGQDREGSSPWVRRVESSS